MSSTGQFLSTELAAPPNLITLLGADPAPFNRANWVRAVRLAAGHVVSMSGPTSRRTEPDVKVMSETNETLLSPRQRPRSTPRPNHLREMFFCRLLGVCGCPNVVCFFASQLHSSFSEAPSDRTLIAYNLVSICPRLRHRTKILGSSPTFTRLKVKEGYAAIHPPKKTAPDAGTAEARRRWALSGTSRLQWVYLPAFIDDGGGVLGAPDKRSRPPALPD